MYTHADLFSLLHGMYHYVRTGKINDLLKNALVIPLLKKYNLDKEILTNYRLISHLPFISKII